MKLITLTPTFSAVNISVMGYNYDWLTNVFLSSNDVTFPFLTAVDSYTTLRRVSSICPSFSGYPITSYTILDRNRVNLSIDASSFTNKGLIDIVFANVAGYTKLSDKNYLIQYLNIDNQIVTIDNGDMLTIDNSYLVYIH